MSRVGPVIKLIFSRQWFLATAAVIIGMGVLARLGVWQLDRLDQRRVQNAALEAALAAPPINLNTTTLPADVTSLKNRDVVAQGIFDFDYQGIIKLQNYQGRPGVHLVAPLVLDGGETAVIVDRGWVPEEDDPDNWAAYDEPGPITINGYIGLTQTLSRPAAVTSPSAELAWYRVDVAAIQSQIPYKLLPVYIKQAPRADEPQPPLRSERQIDLSAGPHLGYAIQWFLFSVILGVMYIAYMYRKIRDHEAASG